MQTQFTPNDVVGDDEQQRRPKFYEMNIRYEIRTLPAALLYCRQLNVHLWFFARKSSRMQVNNTQGRGT
jgi:hypothetical protein